MSRGSLKDTIADFQSKADKNDRKLKTNPFSDKFENQKRQIGDEGYGRPEKGSATEKRGIKAGIYVAREVLFLCEIIDKYGTDDPDGKSIKFGPLFYLYATYSDKEMIDLCEYIHLCGVQNVDGTTETTFGKIFSLYTKISNKVVGMLIRARKHGLVSFEGEMLYQKQDDHKIVTLLKPIEEIKASFSNSGDPQNCLGKK